MKSTKGFPMSKYIPLDEFEEALDLLWFDYDYHMERPRLKASIRSHIEKQGTPTFLVFYFVPDTNGEPVQDAKAAGYTVASATLQSTVGMRRGDGTYEIAVPDNWNGESDE